MKYLKQFIEKGVFNFNDANLLIGNKSTTFTILRSYIDKKYIKKIKRNLYVAVNLESGMANVSKYVIASNINDNSFVSYHSAFEFYGYYNQVYNNVNVSSLNKFNKFSFEDNEYLFNNTLTDKYVDVVRGAKVTCIERTIVDNIKGIGKLTDLEETMKCIDLISYVDENKILGYLNIIGSKILYKKVGYILEYFKDSLLLSDAFLEECINKGGNVKGYFNKNVYGLKYNSKWKLYVYSNLESYL